MSNEHILGIDAATLDATLTGLMEPTGLTLWNVAIHERLRDQLTPALRMLWRPDAEKEDVNGPHHRQILPYAVLSTLIDGDIHYGVYQRVKGTSESRLLGRHSLGFGGHITPADFVVVDGTVSLLSTIRLGMLRELQEETGVDIDDIQNVMVRHVGYIRSDASEVDSLHFACVYDIRVKEQTISTDETHALFKGFFSVEQLHDMAGEVEFENWSKYIIDSL